MVLLNFWLVCLFVYCYYYQSYLCPLNYAIVTNHALSYELF